MPQSRRVIVACTTTTITTAVTTTIGLLVISTKIIVNWIAGRYGTTTTTTPTTTITTFTTATEFDLFLMGNFFQRASEHISLLLVDDVDHSIAENKPLVEEIFRNFCVFGTPHLRKNIGAWLTNMIQDWVRWACQSCLCLCHVIFFCLWLGGRY